MNKLIIALILLFFSLSQSIRGQEDNIKVSLMTCAPGTEIYALFGHTALRYEDKARGEDWVFNYGMFSFNTPHFIYRFVKGETDYELGVTRYPYFEGSYAMRGSSVYQQTLNLTISEKQELRRLLEENYLPENRVYRYNFFYDNCTTRARDVIERCIEGKVVYSEGKEGLSFRDIVHQYTKGHKWDELGIDMCLGSEADKPIDARKQMFAPFYLLEAAKKATIVVGDSVRPLILHEKKVVDAEPENVGDGFPLSPLACVFILIERCIEGKVVYSEGKEGLSFRDIVHQYTKGHKWDELGIDMCLGSEADKPIDARKQMFAPFYLLEAAKKATIVVGDSVRPLILHEKKVVDAEPENVGDGFPLSPLACVFILIGITCFVGWLQFKTRKIIWIWDLLLFGVQGLAGCVITFLVLFSTHPTVGSNWLILLLNPIPLLYLPVMVCRAIKGKKDLYHTINVAYLTLFIMIMPFVQQKFNVTVLPLALCLLICSANHVLLYYRQNNK